MDRASIKQEILNGMNKIRGLPEKKDVENLQKNMILAAVIPNKPISVALKKIAIPVKKATPLD